MNKILPLVPVVVASTLAPSGALAQTSGEQAARLIELPAKTPLNQFRVSARMGYNISAHLKNIGVSSSETDPSPPPPPAGAGPFRSATPVTYQNGYVGIDVTGNNHLAGAKSQTWYWGYATEDQFVDSNLDGIRETLLLTHSASGTLISDFKNDPQAGLEISYARQVGERADGSKYGFEAGLTYTSLDLRSSGIADPNVLVAHGFSLFGPGDPPIQPPLPGPNGFYQRIPGRAQPLLYDTPTPYPVNIVSSFDASIYGLKVGPYFEFPLAKRLSAALSGGFSLLIADTEFRVQQSVRPGIASSTFTSSDIGLLPGGYIGGRLSLMASDSVNVFTGLQYESNGRHTQSAGDKRIEVDFWNAIYWTFGVSYSF